MPVKYSQDFQIPVEFPDVLRDLTKEILRCQPKDINAFGMSYQTSIVLQELSLPNPISPLHTHSL